MHAGTDAAQRYADQAKAVIDFKDKVKGGVLNSIDDLNGVADPAVLASIRDGFFVSNFAIRNVDIVGPQVGGQLKKQALLAIVYSLGGMLIYLAFRFEWIYGVAAVITVFHDTLITVGAFSLLNKDISLTVVAAILTLVGYSNNDTIVVFDRIRENLKLMRREKLSDIVNRSINQTLSRTILTAGLDVFDGSGLVFVRRRSVKWLFPGACYWHLNRDLFVDCHRGANSGCISGLALSAWQRPRNRPNWWNWEAIEWG